MQVSIKKIILATDFSDTSKDAGYRAMFLAHAHKAELIALHVFDIGAWNAPSSYYFIEEARQRGKDALKELAKSFGIKVETTFTEGDPGHEIIRVAEELHADLIVLGTHGHTRWKRFTIGSVVAFVVKHATCAVFTIRPREKLIEPMRRKKLAIVSS